MVVCCTATTAHEALDVAFDRFCESNLEVVRVVGYIATLPCAVPVACFAEDISEVAFRWVGEGAAELIGGRDEASAAFCDVGVILSLCNSSFGFGNGILEHGDEQLVVLDGSVSIDEGLYLFVADGLQNPVAGSSFSSPAYDVAGFA